MMRFYHQLNTSASAPNSTYLFDFKLQWRAGRDVCESLPPVLRTCCPAHRSRASAAPAPSPGGQSPPLACRWSPGDRCCWSSRKRRRDRRGSRRHVYEGPWPFDGSGCFGREGGRHLRRGGGVVASVQPPPPQRSASVRDSWGREEENGEIMNSFNWRM